MTKNELIDILDDTERQLKRVREELAAANRELEWFRSHVQQIEERSRKLDWVLTQFAEAAR